MITGGGDAEGMTASRPHSADPGVLGKARLVLKFHHVSFSQLAEFYLSVDGSASHSWAHACRTNNCPASTDSPSDAAISALGGRSTPLHSAAAGAPPRWDHPRPPEAIRAARGSPPSAATVGAASGPVKAVGRPGRGCSNTPGTPAWFSRCTQRVKVIRLKPNSRVRNM